MSIFHSLEDVDRGSETQLQVGDKLNNLVYKGLINTIWSDFSNQVYLCRLLFY